MNGDDLLEDKNLMECGSMLTPNIHLKTMPIESSHTEDAKDSSIKAKEEEVYQDIKRKIFIEFIRNSLQILYKLVTENLCS